MKRLLISFFICHLTISVGLAHTEKPWTFWYWMYGAVSEQGISADLKAMKDVGLGGCYLMPIRGTAERPEYCGTAQQLSADFWQKVDYAFLQADSLGLEMGIHICDGFALAGGPWISAEESMQKVVWTDTIVSLDRRTKTVNLPQPAKGHEGYYRDIAAFAISVVGEAELPQPQVGGTIVRNDKGVFRSTTAGYIDYYYDRPQTVRSIKILPNGNNVQAQRLLVQASSDGVTYNNVRQLVPPRQGWQNTDEDYTYSLPTTTARYFRFAWTPEGTEPGSEDLDAAKWSPVLKVNDIRLSSQPVIDCYESKNGSVWRISPRAGVTYSHEEAVSIIPLQIGRHGEAILPASIATNKDVIANRQYRIIRFGHTSTGHTNATGGGAKGLECDKFSKEAVNKQIDRWFHQFMTRPHSKVVKYMHVDSWECGSQNWSKTFAEEFMRRRGYDLLPFMPVYAGVPVDHTAEAKAAGVSSDQVLRDIRQTINDLINEVFFNTLSQRAHQYGIQLSSESVAPTMVSDGLEHFRYSDIPMGEFWLNSPTHDKPNDMLDAISGGHIYGKTLIQAEGFTELRGVWDETPAMVKPLLDRQFAMGINRLFFHVFTHNPYSDRRPGMTLDGIGLFFQRDQTWFAEARGFVDYITRCQTLLQQGKPVTDIAVYIGDEMPRRSFTPDRLVPMLPGLFGPERVASEEARLANHGSPMTESPVGVRHAAGIIDMKDWINPLHGYQYDSMNRDALMLCPFNYKVLVIPEGILMADDVKARIDSLRQHGVTIIDKPYHQATIEGLEPDICLPEGIAYTHKMTDDEDIFFLANQKGESVTFTPQFRIKGRETSVYYPVANERKAMNGELTLRPYESVFVILDNQGIPGPVETCLHQAMPLVRIPVKVDFKPWTLHFRESGITLRSDSLMDLSRHTSDSIRYFSGHIRYTTTVDIKKKQLSRGRTWIELPGVHDIAHIWVNGHDCGLAWTEPYEVNASGLLRKGRNTIEIEVVNTWHNALRGADKGAPPYGGIWTNAAYRSKGDALLPAGLLSEPIINIEY